MNRAEHIVERDDIESLLPNVWRKDGEPFNLSATLASGQAFRWRRDDSGVWWGTVESTILAAYQQDGRPEAEVRWQTFPVPNQSSIFEALFRLDVELIKLYADWIRSEPAIDEAVCAFRGLRILRQPPVECFFSFQCASCNTVVKIERSVNLLAQRYGERLYVPAEHGNDNRLHSFPTIADLAAANEQVLRGDLWGYRAPRVIDLASRLLMLGEGWLQGLRTAPYAEAHARLAALPGVGPKVADCICLFSLDKDDAVPIDTHTRQIAVRLFEQNLAAKSLTSRVYTTLANSYRSRFGPYAGWAQQYLFFAELRRSSRYTIMDQSARGRNA
jgi:N-glycosylase/DNA lyase